MWRTKSQIQLQCAILDLEKNWKKSFSNYFVHIWIKKIIENEKN